MVRWTDEYGNVALVSGRHRLEAAIRLGWTEINVRLFVCEQIEARKLEIAENLHRLELTPEERDQHVLEWEKFVEGVEKEVEETCARAQVSSKGGRGKKGGDSKVARETGVGRDTVRRAKKLDKLPLAIKEAADKAGLSRAAKLRIADAPDKKVALRDEVEGRGRGIGQMRPTWVALRITTQSPPAAALDAPSLYDPTPPPPRAVVVRFSSRSPATTTARDRGRDRGRDAYACRAGARAGGASADC